MYVCVFISLFLSLSHTLTLLPLPRQATYEEEDFADFASFTGGSNNSGNNGPPVSKVSSITSLSPLKRGSKKTDAKPGHVATVVTEDVSDYVL